MPYIEWRQLLCIQRGCLCLGNGFMYSNCTSTNVVDGLEIAYENMIASKFTWFLEHPSVSGVIIISQTSQSGQLQPDRPHRYPHTQGLAVKVPVNRCQPPRAEPNC